MTTLTHPEAAAAIDIPDRHGSNVFEQDPTLAKLLGVYLSPELKAHLLPYFTQLGAEVGGELDDLAASADKHPPALQYRNRQGGSDQKILKHPDYVRLEKKAYVELGLARMSHQKGALGWPEVMPPMAKYALTYLFVQAEFGLCCPVSMTDSLTHTLRRYGDEEIVQRYLPNLTTLDFDALTQGAMFITEQGAGSDVSQITTLATEREGEWTLSGDKWFCSNPDAGVAMVLARVAGAPKGLKGLGLFLMPRRRPDGTPNDYQILRLKDKLGTRSMASGEISLNGATAYLLGEVGRGFQQMADMINLSRLSNGVRAAGLMRRAVGEALYVCQNRRAFGKALIEMPLQQKQLLKMMLPSEQARSMFLHTALSMHASHQGDVNAAKRVRVLTPLIKFRACRDARKVTGDAMEVRGGCGFIEEWSDPRILRDAHLGSIWEGTSNIVALDVMRSIQRNEALVYLGDYLNDLLAKAPLPDASALALSRKLAAVLVFVAAVAEANDEANARKAASALYHITSAVIMAWEAVQMGDDWQRLAWAHLVLRHKLSPEPLLQADDHARDAEVLQALLAQQPVTKTMALSLLPAEEVV
ncbi:MAG: acyl-CoA dehydrogenase family protein [Neisseriaceae bacterium]|nr:acyl-CoA dehydrogenase family protein [Neisseriaceae bacterium]